MTQFHNKANLRNSNGETKRKVYVHQPLTIEHFGIQASIRENGKVLLSKVAGVSPDNPEEVEVDEIEIPASLIFKLGNLLRDTRQVKFVTVAEVAERK